MEIRPNLSTEAVRTCLREFVLKSENLGEKLKATESINDEIENRFDIIENNIDIRRESIVVDLDKIQEKLVVQLNAWRDQRLKHNAIIEEQIKSKLSASCDEKLLRKWEKLVKRMKRWFQFEFQASESNFSPEFFGFLTEFYWKRVQSVRDISFNVHDLHRVVYIKSKNKAIVSNYNSNDLLMIDLHDYSVEVFEHEDMHTVYALCVGKNDELFVSENTPNQKILVFDSSMNYKRKFNLKNEYFTNKMIIDGKDKSERNLMYISNYGANQVSIWNTQSGDLVNKFKVDAPSFMETSQEYIYVVSYTIYDKERETDSFKRIKSGSNCIFIVDKASLLVVDKIAFDNWLQPRGLHIDTYGNLLTTALKIDNVISANRHLFTISTKGKLLLSEIEIPTDSNSFYDMISFDCKILLCLPFLARTIEFK